MAIRLLVYQEILKVLHQVQILSLQQLRIKKSYYGLQFHPEVVHTPNGHKIIENFIFKICKKKKLEYEKSFKKSDY